MEDKIEDVQADSLKEKKGKTPPAATFVKEDILKMKQYKNRVDLLGVLLNPNQPYTFEQIDSVIDKFMKGAK